MKAQTIYDITMAIMDEMKNDGKVDVNTTKDYLARSPGILTTLQTDIILEFKRQGIKAASLDIIKTMENDVDLDDDICVGILTYGLAGKLLAQEDTTLSNYFNSLFENKTNKYISSYREPVSMSQREDEYNSNMRVGD